MDAPREPDRAVAARPPECTVVCLARSPELGKVKTRLAADVGDEEALRIYRLLVKHTVEVLNALPEIFDVEISLAEPCEPELFREVFGDRPRYTVQSEGDLGARMQEAAETAFARGARKVILIGSDCPCLLPSHLLQARNLLSQRSVVLGPSTDGGYYLIGMTEVYPTLFTDLPWSTDQVLAETRSRLRDLDMDAAYLETLSDIDTIEDWNLCGKEFT